MKQVIDANVVISALIADSKTRESRRRTGIRLRRHLEPLLWTE